MDTTSNGARVMNHTASPVRVVTKEAAITYISQVSDESKIDLVISIIPQCTTEEMHYLRERAQIMKQNGWRLESALDAEMLIRAPIARGRGVKDDGQIGVLAAAKEIAAEAGVTPRTIMRNAQLHNEFFEGEYAEENKQLADTVLPDKSFWLMAQRANDRQEAIRRMAEQVATGRPYRANVEGAADVVWLNNKDYQNDVAVFGVLYADPSWGDKDGTYWDVSTVNPSRVAADDAILFFRTTSAKVGYALDMVKRWGFLYDTACVLTRTYPMVDDYTIQGHDLVLIAHRGESMIPAPGNRPSSVMNEEEIHATIARMFPAQCYLDVFPGQAILGDKWTKWSEEVKEKELVHV